MTTQEKTALLTFIRSGKIQDAIDGLLSTDLSESKKKEVLAIASRNQRLKSQNRLGILSYEQANTIENQIVANLIDLINFPDDQIYPSEKSIEKPISAHFGKKEQLSGYKISIIGSIALILCVLLFLLPFWNEEAPYPYGQVHPLIDFPSMRQ